MCRKEVSNRYPHKKQERPKAAFLFASMALNGERFGEGELYSLFKDLAPEARRVVRGTL